MQCNEGNSNRITIHVQISYIRMRWKINEQVLVHKNRMEEMVVVVVAAAVVVIFLKETMNVSIVTTNHWLLLFLFWYILLVYSLLSHFVWFVFVHSLHFIFSFYLWNLWIFFVFFSFSSLSSFPLFFRIPSSQWMVTYRIGFYSLSVSLLCARHSSFSTMQGVRCSFVWVFPFNIQFSVPFIRSHFLLWCDAIDHTVVAVFYVF